MLFGHITGIMPVFFLQIPVFPCMFFAKLFSIMFMLLVQVMLFICLPILYFAQAALSMVAD